MCSSDLSNRPRTGNRGSRISAEAVSAIPRSSSGWNSVFTSTSDINNIAAIRTYERLQSDLGADNRSLRSLAALYEREGRWGDVALTLQELSGRLDGAEAVELYHRVVNLFERELHDEDEAGRVLEAAYARFPADEATRTRLKAFHEARGEYQCR